MVDILHILTSPFFGWDIGGLYQSSYSFVDFIIYLIFFVAISKLTLAEKFKGRQGKAVAIVVGISLAIGMSVFSNRFGFILGDIAPLAGAVFILLLAVVLYKLLRDLGAEIPGAAAISFLILYFTIIAIMAPFYSWLISHAPILDAIFAIAVLMAVFVALRDIIRAVIPAKTDETFPDITDREGVVDDSSHKKALAAAEAKIKQAQQKALEAQRKAAEAEREAAEAMKRARQAPTPQERQRNAKQAEVKTKEAEREEKTAEDNRKNADDMKKEKRRREVIYRDAPTSDAEFEEQIKKNYGDVETILNKEIILLTDVVNSIGIFHKFSEDIEKNLRQPENKFQINASMRQGYESAFNNLCKKYEIFQKEFIHLNKNVFKDIEYLKKIIYSAESSKAVQVSPYFRSFADLEKMQKEGFRLFGLQTRLYHQLIDEMDYGDDFKSLDFSNVTRITEKMLDIIRVMINISTKSIKASKK